MTHAYNPTSWETKAGELMLIPHQPAVTVEIFIVIVVDVHVCVPLGVRELVEIPWSWSHRDL